MKRRRSPEVEYREFCARETPGVDEGIAIAILYHGAEAVSQTLAAGLKPEMVGEPTVAALVEEAVAAFSEDPRLVEWEILAPRLRERDDVDPERLDELTLAVNNQDVAKAVAPYVAAKQAVDRHPYALIYSMVHPALEQIRTRSISWERGVNEVAEGVQHGVEHLTRGRRQGFTAERRDELIATLRDPAKPGEGKGYITTGIHVLDQATGGLGPKTLWGVGANTSVGKTALAATVAAAVISRRHHIQIWTAEISADDYATRIALALDGKLKYRPIDNALGGPSAVEEDVVARLKSGWDVVIDYADIREGPFSVQDVERALITAAEERRPRVVFIDQLDLMQKPKVYGAQPHERLREISRRLKDASFRHGVTVFMLQQFGRELVEEAPKHNAFRDAAIENDIDVGIGLWKPKASDLPGYLKGEQDTTIGVHLMKSRKSPNGRKLWLRYDRETQAIGDIPE